jgi:hypothetical protein
VKIGFFNSKYSYSNHQIGFEENRQYFWRKMAKIAKNSDHMQLTMALDNYVRFEEEF